MDANEVAELLKDARLVREYGVRAGRLPDDALANAIASTDRSAATDAVSDTVPLVSALNAAVRAIAPMTLIELRAGRSPFEGSQQKSNHILQVGLSITTIVVIALVGYFTQLLHQEDTSVKALQRIQDVRPLDKLNSVRKMVQVEGVLAKRDSQYDGYHRAVTDLRNLQDEMASTYQMASAVAVRAAWPFRRLATLQSGASYAAEAGAQANGSAGVAEAASSVAPDVAQNLRNEAQAPASPACGADTEPHWLCGVLADVVDEFQFSTGLGLGIHSFNWISPSFLRYQLQSDIAVLNGWILPLLYGLLGAAVFLMRNMLDTRTPNLTVIPSILRIALGGVAGIVIGWFWVPGPSPNAELAAVTSAPFALAFLAGFSIEMLFSLLDRLNRAVIEETGKGKLPAPDTSAPASVNR